MAKVFHVLTPEQKETFLRDNSYHPESLDNEGFIHFSKADQIDSVIQNFYSCHEKLILWRIAENKLEEKLVYEPPLEAPSSGILFPHYYQSLDYRYVEKAFTLAKKNGKFILPSNLLE